MAKNLIIVESPAKVKTIKKFLGSQYEVLASVGHVRDLPSKELGVDEQNNFMPKYQVIENKEKVVSKLRSAAANANTVYLAPDPDREGEAIAWHVAELIKDKAKDFKRIQFNEITAKAVRDALQNPRELNTHLFDAQQARRILDRLVGYKISPLLWKNVKRGISAGRVQSVALRLIVEREEERQAFKPEEYWLFKAILEADNPPAFKADLHKVKGKKAKISNEKEALALEKAMQGQDFIIDSIEEKERKKDSQPPFITSSLQQMANQRLGYGAKRTMSIAQRLYEGIEIQGMGITALITYMRTDSTRIADEAKQAAAEFIENTYGAEYLPKKGKVYKKKANAQDAHEAIRPVDVNITPDMLKDDLAPDQYSLYKLIWTRFVASQMIAAVFHDTIVTINCAISQWRSKGVRMLFPGWTKVFPRSAEDSEADLPNLKVGQVLNVQKLTKEQKFTQPPARYSEASLVRELEEKGIGRPSTYASIISTLQDREYVILKDKHFSPTDLGNVVCDKLRTHFSTLMDVGFTAHMEDSLDKVADGEKDWVNLMQDFAADFYPTLDTASKDMQSIKTGIVTDLDCPECAKKLTIKFGKNGSFLACTGYPECSFTSDFEKDEQGNVKILARETVAVEVVGKCPECGHDLVIKKSRAGSKFIACSNYPNCKHVESISTGVACPQEGCTGELVERSSKRGKIFYSCNQYPKCDYALWDMPLKEPCPKCGFPFLTRKIQRGGAVKICCPEKSCGYVQEDDE